MLLQVVCEVYCTNTDIVCPTHVLVSLVLYKMADCQAEVRANTSYSTLQPAPLLLRQPRP